MMKNEYKFDLHLEIQGCIQYLRSRQEFDGTSGKSFYDESGCANFLKQLESTESDLNNAVEHLQRIATQFKFGKMEPFSNVELGICEALDQALNAWVNIRNIHNQVRLEHPGKTRELSLQKSALRLAYAMKGEIGQRKIRTVAAKIMKGVGLDCPTDSTLTKWLQVFKTEDKLSKNVK